METKIKELIEKYYNDCDECYTQYFYDENDKEFSMNKEIEELFKNSGLKYKIDLSECFESCGYDCDMLSVAWIENDELFMENILLERY